MKRRNFLSAMSMAAVGSVAIPATSFVPDKNPENGSTMEQVKLLNSKPLEWYVHQGPRSPIGGEGIE